jgi:hypothetical protein
VHVTPDKLAGQQQLVSGNSLLDGLVRCPEAAQQALVFANQTIRISFFKLLPSAALYILVQVAHLSVFA